MDYNEIKKFSSLILLTSVAVCAVVIKAAALLEGCQRDEDCPQNAHCRPRGCERFLCQCRMGYHAFSRTNGTCEKVSLIDESCSSSSRCLAVNSHCDHNRNTCLCEEGMTASTDKFRCKPIGSDQDPGDACNATVGPRCDFYSVCEDGVCYCMSFSDWSIEEKWLMYPRPTFLPCKTPDLSLYSCNGTEVTMASIVDVPEVTLTTSTAAAATTTSSTTTTITSTTVVTTSTAAAATSTTTPTTTPTTIASTTARVTTATPAATPASNDITPKAQPTSATSTPLPEATAAMEVHTMSPPPAIPVFITEQP